MKKKKRKVKKNNKIMNTEISLIIGMLASILLALSIYTDSIGSIGSFLKKMVFTVFGIGGYILPVIIIGGFITYIFFNEKMKRFIIGVSLIYFSLIGFFSIKLDNDLQNYNVFFKNSNETMGGLLGGFISYIFEKLLGNTGTIVVYFFLVIIGLYIILEKNMGFYYSKVKKIFIREKKIKKESKKQIIRNTQSDYAEETEVKISSYDKAEIQNTKKIEMPKSITGTLGAYIFPPISLLKDKKEIKTNEDRVVKDNIKKLLKTLENFGVKAEIDRVNIGPTVTKYELLIEAGVKVSKITGLSNDIALSLAATDVRIEAPIPGKSAIGIEVPNKNKMEVRFKEIISSEQFKNIDSLTPIGLGKDIEGKSIVVGIEKMPHLLIAGATGSGKSVCINTIINSIIFKSKPEEAKLILIDPKVVELSIYNGIPHLMTPVVTDPKKATGVLNWTVKEMTDRYNLFAESNVRDITGYNSKVKDRVLPRIVVIIDELADLMMVASSEVETLICRIAQMARAAGIHLIIATQRPSVDVITGVIKANIPSRISFSVSSQTDSRTILDMGGAEKLLGQGDMLYYPMGAPKPIRIQGAYIDDSEVENVVEYLKENNSLECTENLEEELEESLIDEGKNIDPLVEKATTLVREAQKGSISLLQRELNIGYNRASKIMKELEEMGVVERGNGKKSRKVL